MYVLSCVIFIVWVSINKIMTQVSNNEIIDCGPSSGLTGFFQACSKSCVGDNESIDDLLCPTGIY